MNLWIHGKKYWHLVGLAMIGAFLLALFFPLTASAHALLLRSDPAKGAVLNVAPQQVRMWFSEDLNPALSTAVVIDANSQRVDLRDAHVSAIDAREMDVTLTPNLSPEVYIVVWRTASAADGHIVRDTFQFTIASADGTVPALHSNTLPGANILGSGSLSGQFDGITFFNVIMISLVELGTIFWVGAQFWVLFVLQLAKRGDEAQESLQQQVQQRFEQRWSLPLLVGLLIANIGILMGQALYVTGGQVIPALAPQVLTGLIANGRFGTYWIAREIVLILAILLALGLIIYKKRPGTVANIVPSINLLLGSMLCVAITMSSDASAVNANALVEAVLVDWFHLIAASLWVGGMLYVALIYLPVLQMKPPGERVQSLVSLLPYAAFLVIAGVLLIAITGPLSASIQLNSWRQVLDTSYGRALLVKVVLVILLLITSAIHVFFLRPQLAKEYKKYAYAKIGVTFNRVQQVKLREGRLEKQAAQLTRLLRWEPLIGVAVVICVGLMSVFGGTLVATPA